MDEQDVAIAREFAGAQAHLPAFVEAVKRYGNSAHKLNASPIFTEITRWNTVEYLYHSLLAQYGMYDKDNHILSDVGVGEMCERADL